jgi:hypothetical protein
MPVIVSETVNPLDASPIDAFVEGRLRSELAVTRHHLATPSLRHQTPPHPMISQPDSRAKFCKKGYPAGHAGCP